MSVALVLSNILRVYTFILLARVILSWVRVGGGGGSSFLSRDNPIIQAIYQLTDPPVNFIRQFMPQTGMMDFSVLILFLLINFLQRFVITLPF